MWIWGGGAQAQYFIEEETQAERGSDLSTTPQERRAWPGGNPDTPAAPGQGQKGNGQPGSLRQGSPGGRGCLPTHPGTDIYPSPWLRGSEADTHTHPEDKKQVLLAQPAPPLIYSFHKHTLNVRVMGLLGEQCLQVKGKSHRVPGPSSDQQGPEGGERGSQGHCWSSCPAPPGN